LRSKKYLTHSMTCILVVPLSASISRGSYTPTPSRPIITEVYNSPFGNDGPTGRTPGNLHQEFVELFVPDAANLDSSLNKDFLRLTFYEVEGDSSSPERGHVNQRFDLPPLDLDPSNGIIPSALPRPSNGVIILGWVDYNTLNPPTALRGTPSTRTGLINGGVTTSPPGALFIAINGNQFGGTTNFATPQAESFIDVPDENSSGVFKNGSQVYLLVNRDDPGYSLLVDRRHPELGPSNAALPSGTVLRLSALLDGFAGNDDVNFDVLAQPLVTPTGLNLDLEDVLPAGGVFSNWIAQVPEGTGGGYARLYADAPKTTEDGVDGNESPSADAVHHYREVFRTGPFFPTPGKVVFTSSPPELGVSEPPRLMFEVLAGTTGRPGLLCANVGGNFPIDITAAPGLSSNPTVVTFATAWPATSVGGQSNGFPRIAASVPLSAPNGSIVTAPVSVTASNSRVGDPPVQNANGTSTIQTTVLRPSTGIDQNGLPHDATVFAALQGLGADPSVANEIFSSTLGQYVLSKLGREVLVALGHGDLLVASATDLESLDTVGPLRQVFPSLESDYINVAGAPGTLDLVDTVRMSPKFIVSPTAYALSFNAPRTAVRAYKISIPETLTSGGPFSPSEMLFFVDSLGDEFNERSGLSWATTHRTFELALLETNATSTGIEDGGGDDFGMIVEVGRTRVGAPVVPGELVFLSYAGGLGGEDIDGVEIPGLNATVAIFVDLDNLDAILGCETITGLFLVDASGSGTVNIIEAISLNPRCAAHGTCPFFGDGDRNGSVDLRDNGILIVCLQGPNVLPAGACSMFDVDEEGDVDLKDYASYQRVFMELRQ